MEGNGKRGNTTDADLEEEAEPATEAPLRLFAGADLALRRVKLIQMENKREYI